jgi:hypothetical protein
VLQNLGDSEVRRAIGEDKLEFHVQLTDADHIFLTGSLGADGWRIMCQDQNDRVPTFRFKLKSMDRDAAIAASASFVRQKLKLDDQPRDLTAIELRQIGIAAANAATVAQLVAITMEYLELSLPGRDAQLELANPERRDLVIQAIYFCWRNSTFGRGFVESDEAISSLNAYLAVREFPTLTTIIEWWQDFQNQQNNGLRAKQALEAKQAARIAKQNAPPSQKDLEDLSDEEAEKLWLETRKLRSQGAY